MKHFRVWHQGSPDGCWVELMADSVEDALDIEAAFNGFEDYDEMKSWERYLCAEEVHEEN